MQIVVQAIAATLAVPGCVAVVVLFYAYGLGHAKRFLEWFANPLHMIVCMGVVLVHPQTGW